MCFSAPASFLASVVLCAAGVATCRLARNKRQLLLAAIPLLFGIQQAAEGFVWLSFSYPALEPWRFFFAYLFLFFAFILWPIWVPLAVYCYGLQDQQSVWAAAWHHVREGVQERISGHAITHRLASAQLFAQKLLIGAGAVVSGYLTMGLMTHDLIPQIVGCHVLYSFPFAKPQIIISSVLYIAATVGACLISPVARMRIFGLVLAVSYLGSALWYNYAFISVWCFFAAILSAGIWWIMREQNQK